MGQSDRVDKARRKSVHSSALSGKEADRPRQAHTALEEASPFECIAFGDSRHACQTEAESCTPQLHIPWHNF